MSILKSGSRLLALATIAMICLALAGSASGALVYEYDAAQDANGTGDNSWQPNINTSLTRNLSLSNQSFVSYTPGTDTAYAGITGAYSFTGTGSGGTTATYGRDSLPLGGGSNNDAGASAAFELWVKPNRASLADIGDEVLFETGGTTSGANIGFEATSGGVDLTFRTRKGNNNDNSVVTQKLTDDALLGDFIQIVGVVDPAGGSKQTRLYLNGLEIGNNTDNKNWQDGNNNAGLARVNGALGGAGNSSEMFNGEVALFRLYDEPLSSAEVLASWNGVTGASGPPLPAMPDPVAFWDFEDNKADVDAGVAGAVVDKSGNGRNGTATNDATLATDVPAMLSDVGMSTSSLRLDGTGDQVNIAGYKGVTGTDARTVAAWVKLEDDDPRQNRSIMSWGDNSGGEKWNFRVQDGNGTDGAIRVEVNGGYVVGSTDITDQEWHHVAAVWEDDGSPNVNDVLLYVDGVLEGDSARQGQSIDTAIGKDVQLGRDHNNRRMMGWLDDMRVYDEALSAAQIHALANPASAAVPEPSTCVLAALGLLGLSVVGWRRRRRA